MSGPPKSTASPVGTAELEALQEISLLLNRRIRRYSGTELTLSQMSALATLRRSGAIRVGELARHELINKSSVTRLVANLEAMGYVAREVDPTDGRSLLVEITDNGHRLLAQSRECASAYLAGEVAQLSDQQRDALVRALPALQALVSPHH
ncbi:MarR family winged helix-turn-helix transcriptional regulator [Nocardioides sp.]|uniref:MarR family winged helix-turn-helix transcriptional regulator n=1 Tax=Nocardioides sp. TaxID=35761 RepID=UPI003D12CD5B